MSLNLAALPLLPVRFEARFHHRRAPPWQHAAEVWRGALKHALESCDDSTLARLQAPELQREVAMGARANTRTPGYVLRVAPPESGGRGDPSAQWVYLTFFGHAAELSLRVLLSLLRSATDGIGAGAMHFDLAALQCHGAGGWRDIKLPLRPGDMRHHQWQLQCEMPSLPHGSDALVALHFPQRVRLIEQGARLHEMPPLAVVTRFLVERANRLGRLWGGGVVADESVARVLLDAAASARELVEMSAVRFEDRTLSSSRQGQRVPSAGVRGHFVYELPGEALDALLPLLRLGSWIHVGQQTTVGAGYFRVLTEAPEAVALSQPSDAAAGAAMPI